MRFVLTAVFWLATTVALAVAIPAVWAQFNLVDEDGYAAMTQQAAADPGLQTAMAAELATRATALIAEHGGGSYRSHPVDSSQVHAAAVAFTASPSFPPLFAQANRAAHRWLFTESQNGDQWLVDVAPMLNDSAFQPILSSYKVKVPAALTVPLTVSLPSAQGSSTSPQLHQGQLHRLAYWGPRISVGAAVAAGFFALLTVLTARGRGKVLTCLGVSALLVGAAGWAAIEVGGRQINDALNRTTGDIRQIAEVMVGHAEGSLHLWLNLVLVAGVALVVLGVVVAVLGSLRK